MDSRLTKHKALPKPLLLKDFLLDDMGSCSSSGFKSFPRRQCCTTTVQFLIDIDLNQMKRQKRYSIFNKTPPALLRNPSKSALSAFQTLITAVKRLPFSAATSPENKTIKKSILPRNLSKKILKRTSFWKRKSDHKEIERWKSFDQLLKEESEPLDIPNSSITTTASGGKSKSWSESVFTASDLCSSSNSLSEVNLNLTEVRKAAVEVVKDSDVSTDSTAGSDSSATNASTTKQWPISEEKEQFSPVSVLDCPFDDDEEVSSPFQHMEGTKKKLMEKIQRFGFLAQLEPVNLAKRFPILLESENESTGSTLPHSSTSIAMSSIEEEQEARKDDENQAEQKALDLFHQFKDTLPSYSLEIKADKLLLDFFREKSIDCCLHSKSQWGGCSFDEEVLEEAENWINERKPGHELFLGWEVPRNRQAYLKDIEKNGEWKSLEQEIQEVASELEAEVSAALLNELLLDISSKATV